MTPSILEPTLPSADVKNASSFFSRPVILLIVCVLGSAWVVLNLEYQSGHFLSIFYKPPVWHAPYNKILIPVLYWACWLVYLAALRLLEWERKREQKETPPGPPARMGSLFRGAFFFHLYLLMLTHTREIVPVFSRFPTRWAPIEFIARWEPVQFLSLYQTLFSQTFFVIYYFFALRALSNLSKKPSAPEQLILPVSLTVPFLFGYFPATHLGLLCLALAFLWVRHAVFERAPQTFLANASWQDNQNFHLAVIFLSGLALRLIYASYLSSYGDVMVGFAADGKAYYQSALGFATGRLDQVEFGYASLYSFYLSLFLRIFGESPDVLFWAQAWIGSLVPVLIYLIALRWTDRTTAFIAGILVASSHLCIHYSAVINRATALTVAFTLLVFFISRFQFSRSSRRPLPLLAIGFFSGSAFYLGQELLLALLFLIAFPLRRLIKTSALKNSQALACLTFGLLLAWGPLNLIYFKHAGELIPLGRVTFNEQLANIAWKVEDNPYSKQLDELGFNPHQSVKKSFQTLAESPLLTTRLLLQRAAVEASALILYPGGIIFMPIHLAWDTFYAAHLQFYFYLFTLAGFFVLRFKKEAAPLDKWTLAAPILALVFSLAFLMSGELRFKAAIIPISLLFTAGALHTAFFSRKEETRIESPPDDLIFFQRIFRNQPPGLAVSITGLSALVALSVLCLQEAPAPQFKPGLHWTPWKHVIGSSLAPAQQVDARLAAHSFYSRSDLSDGNYRVAFNACSFLYVGSKAWYQVMVDERPLGNVRKLPRGCFKFEEAFQPEHEKGKISFNLFVSHSGKLALSEPYSKVILKEGRRETWRFFRINTQDRNDPKLNRYANDLINSTMEGVRLGPILTLAPTSALK